MKKPQLPPPFEPVFDNPLGFLKILEVARVAPESRYYLHWDRLRRYPPPAGITSKEWWIALKYQRLKMLKPVSLKDKRGQPFQFCIPELMLEALHQIDIESGGSIGLTEPITNPQTRDQYLVRSLMEEAITSSQLEGAVTTREAAKEMIRTGRAPRDKDERMILNNFQTMRRIRDLKDTPLSSDLVFEIHRLVTDRTLDDPTAAGRLRRTNEHRVVADDTGEVFHDPPLFDELPERLQTMCDFANHVTPGYFIHPAVRAMILHFWLAYDHPFVDGNGRTARALFYWAMLRAKYWLFEFISISHFLRKAPIKYARSFLYTETDDNDLTYFIVAQTSVIRIAIAELHQYIERKTHEMRESESHLRALDLFNHRQVDLLLHALNHPRQQYTIKGHQTSHQVVYQTARADLLDLASRAGLQLTKRGKKMIFTVPSDLTERLLKLEKASSSNFTSPP